MAKKRQNGRKTSQKGIDLIKVSEGCQLTAYPDPGSGGDPWTIGYGHTGPDVKPGLRWTQQQAEDQLRRDLARYEAEVTAALAGAPTTQSQFDALVSFHFNTGSIRTATLTKLHKAGDYAAAAEQFGRWVYAGGRVMPGLVTRRARERQLYLSD